MSNQALANFLAAMEQPAREETYPLIWWRQLNPGEQRVVEDRLIRRAADQGDDRAMATLAAIGSQRALPELEKLAQEKGFIGANARRAVLKLQPNPQNLQAVTTDLQKGSQQQRFTAARDLGQQPDDAALTALLQALEDPDSLVRMEAYEQILQKLGLTPLMQDARGQVVVQSPLARLNLLLGTELRTLYGPAAEEIRELARAQEHKKLQYVPGNHPELKQKLTDALGDADVPIPVQAIAQAQGHDRAWAEALLAAQLQPEVADVRVPQAFVDLKALWILPVLLEAAPQAEEQGLKKFAQAARQAAEKLK